MEPVHVWLADTVGDGSGTTNAVGNYAAAATPFKVRSENTAGSSDHLEVYRLIVNITDAGAPDAGKYGNNIVLTNGITVGLYNAAGTLTVDLTDGEPIITNADWGRLAYDVKATTFGLGDDSVAVRWTFAKFGGPIILSDGEYVAVVLNDDLTGLVSHYFTFEGTGVRG